MHEKITLRSENYPQWYLDVIEAADLAEHSVVKGCMVIKPHGYAIWENIQKILDRKFKETGHVNAYFPLFIPKSFLSREAEHVEGFAKECAVVTHHRLKNDSSGKGVIVDPDATLEEELIVRPTSETIIHDTFSRWIQSYRDLPLLINQWANVVRWEMRTRLFLRTTEFLWQEGHTAHETEEDAEKETLQMLEVYRSFLEEYFALPVMTGLKSESEKFAGALRTYTLEAMMQDKKALQTGTSHNLGQNFSKTFEIRFADRNGDLKYVWQTSWGVSTRLIGALIMAHSDDKGLVLPPKIAPIKLILVPIYKTDEERREVLEYVTNVASELRALDESVKIDDRDYLTPGHKYHEWEKKGVPLRLEIGPRDIAKNELVVVRRDTGEKIIVKRSGVLDSCRNLLDQMQTSLFTRASEFLRNNTSEVDAYEDFKKRIEEGGFFSAPWCGSAECEKKVNEETTATIRCIPFDASEKKGKCMVCGGESLQRVIFAKAY